MDYIVNKIKNEPAVVVGLLVSGIVFLAAKYNVVLDEASVEAVVFPLVTGVLSRFFVVPTNNVPGKKPGV